MVKQIQLYWSSETVISDTYRNSCLLSCLKNDTDSCGARRGEKNRREENNYPGTFFSFHSKMHCTRSRIAFGQSLHQDALYLLTHHMVSPGFSWQIGKLLPLTTPILQIGDIEAHQNPYSSNKRHQEMIFIERVLAFPFSDKQSNSNNKHSMTMCDLPITPPSFTRTFDPQSYPVKQLTLSSFHCWGEAMCPGTHGEIAKISARQSDTKHQNLNHCT